MAKFEILTHLRRTDDVTPAARAGLQLAKRLDAWVLGLYVVPIAPAAFASPEAVAVHVHEADQLYAEALERAQWWRGQLDGHGLAGEWQVSQGDTVEALCHAARWCDLVVMERPQSNPDAPTGWGVVSRTVFGAATPVVVVPETARLDSLGTRVLIAWNHSRESNLAIREALPLLVRAENVTVLAGDPAENPFGLRYLPKLDLDAWLKRRGVNARFRAFKPERNHGAALLDAAHAVDADLIVMGAWGHSRVSELVLGGCTRHLFQTSDLPLLVAH
ncbi:MAG TPA: universal stress protein [Rhodanobacteraceae bacterium]|nr:universal stress protein [Rhodanobacteraceae bacterium]